MAKRNFDLTPQEIQTIQQVLLTCTDNPTCDRLQAILWYGAGKPITEITAHLGCSRSALMSWCQAYRTSGVMGLIDRRLGGNNCRLTPAQVADLRERLRTLAPREAFSRKTATPQGLEWTVQDLYRAVRMWYGVVYRSRASYYQLFARVKPQGEKDN
jgi:transposase